MPRRPFSGQALGYALLENTVLDDRGVMQNAQFTNYIIPTTLDTPNMDVTIVEAPYSKGPFGAKGVGELPMDVPAPAVAAAIHDATGLFMTELPILPERLCKAFLDGELVNSCLIPVYQADGSRVETIEALGKPEDLAPLQAAFLTEGGAQCGICTPGMVMSAWAFLRDGGRDDPDAIRTALAGNLCRCTGYQHIVDSVVSTVRNARGKRSKGTKKK